ncbi:delta(24)-sterol reductase-like [Thrips palmi]|uniref:Delta(24)-sterol reductase n=1 Tax=Thrips palmi TaxID=161013 RepID=A0A6P8YZ66_THRPL|nr:delta(24)-sterol reductase-like [Thrips palmi]
MADKQADKSPDLRSRIVAWLEENRELVVLLFCLPASFVFSLLLSARAWLRARNSSPQHHDARVRDIQRAVRVWGNDPAAKKKLLCTARPNWLSLSTTFFRKDQCHRIPVPLYDILSLDEANMTVRVEPMVTVGQITSFLVPRGYTLAVTLEIADATLGGLAMGTGMTTHSHKVGLYHETIEAYEVVVADGSVVRATRDNQHADLFKALPWSHGSLAFLTALELKLVKVKPYVKLRYLPVRGQRAYCDAVRKYSGALGPKEAVAVPDFVEATIFSKDEAVVMLGDFSDGEPGVPVNHITAWYKPWWYKYVESIMRSGRPHEELVPMREYLLRHNRAIFWVVEDMLPNGNHPLFRLLFGWLLPPKPAFLKFTTTPGIRALTFAKQVFQDIVLPINDLERQVDTSEELFDSYPLLVYPCRVYDRGPKSGQLRRPPAKHLVPGTDYAMYNDLGIYGVPGKVKRREPYDPVDAMRAMEKFTRGVGGFAFLYADIFMTRDEFEAMFDLALYEEVRAKYGAEGAFPHLFDKVRPEVDVIAIGKEYATK